MLHKTSKITALVLILVFIGNVFFSTVWANTAGDFNIINLDVFSNRHTQPNIHVERTAPYLDTEGYILKLENDKLEVWFREDVAGMRFRVKETGYVWGSVYRDGDDRVKGMNARWTSKATSFASIDYFDWQGAQRQIGLADPLVEMAYVWHENGFYCDVAIDEFGFFFRIAFTLHDDHISFEVVGQPREESRIVPVQRRILREQQIVHEEHYHRIKAIYFMPFMGSVYEAEMGGYMFVPDGSGALIRFPDGAKYVASYEQRVYGLDFGIDPTAVVTSLNSSRPDDYVVPESQALMPVFGTAHGFNEHAFFARIENGAEFATIIGNVAGLTMRYNYAAARFDYRLVYTQPVNQRGLGVMMPQPHMNEMEPRISFYFLSGSDADYAGMARLYRSILLDEGVLKPTTAAAEDIPIRVDVLGADLRQGFLRNTVTALTTAGQAKTIVDMLRENGVNNINMTVLGWQRGGINGSRLNATAFERRVGSASDFKSLRDKVEENGAFFLGIAPVRVNDRQLNLYMQAVTNLSRAHVVFCYCDFGRELMFYDFHLVRPRLVYNNVRQIRQSQPGFNFAYDQLGHFLYADHTNRNVIKRNETKELFHSMAKGGAYVYPNAYLWDSVDVFLNAPLGSSQYLFATDTVPFLQMVLRGSMDYFASYTNTGLSSLNSMLKKIEYGAYPSFILTGVESRYLQNTPQAELFTTWYVDWISEIAELYHTINSALSLVEGQGIYDHEALDYGIKMTTFTNGISIFVNYSVHDYYDENNDITIPARWFAVK